MSNTYTLPNSGDKITLNAQYALTNFLDLTQHMLFTENQVEPMILCDLVTRGTGKKIYIIYFTRQRRVYIQQPERLPPDEIESVKALVRDYIESQAQH